MNKISNEKGSTLMLILITVAILSILGTALLSMSLMNINMKKSDYWIKKSSYYAESGIDQVYARVGKIVEEAMYAAVESTDDDLTDIFVILDEIVALEDPSTHLQYMTYSAFLTDTYVLDTTFLESFADGLYKEYFRSYLNDLDNDGDATNDIDYVLTQMDYLFLDNNNASNGSQITISLGAGNIEEFAEPDIENNVFVLRDLNATFLLADRTRKTIATDIVITDEIAAYPMNTIEERIKVKDNPIWQQPLVSNGDIDFSNADVSIDGNVYGYGTLPVDTVSAEPEDFGGIRLFDDSSVVVDGNVYSRSYVQLGQGSLINPNSSALTVNNGLVYANSLVIQKNASGSMLVNGNVYTSDDLEMNGTGASDITVNGSYYGYTDGASIGATHDASSAIVLNSDMDAASLKITGLQPVGVDYVESQPGILIGGTAYVDVDPVNYQTSESVSIRGNYIAYTWSHNQAFVDQLIADDVFRAYPYNFYEDASTRDAKLTAHMLSENVQWQAIEGSSARLAVGSALTGDDSSLKDRMAYFTAFKNYVDNNSNNFIKRGTPETIELSNYIYTTGLQLVANDFLYNPTSIVDYQILSNKISADYMYQLHQMTYRSGAGQNNIDLVGATQELPDYTNINPYEKYTNLDIDADNYWVSNSNGVSVIDGVTVMEVRHISTSVEPLHLYGAGMSGAEDNNNRYIGARAQGLIVRNGDVYIHGNMTFDGAIITSGNIYCVDGQQTFRNDSETMRHYLAAMIYRDNRLYNQFEVTHYSGPGSASLDLDELAFVNIDFDSSANDDDVYNAYNFHEWLYFDHWRVEE